MNIKVIIPVAMIALIAFSSFLLINKRPNLNSEQPTIFDWHSCIQNTAISSCDKDVDPLDVDDCNAAATATTSCNSESSASASQSCTHWWYYYVTAQAGDALPDSFYECASDCLTYAQQNNFYYSNFYSPMWINCALPTHDQN